MTRLRKKEYFPALDVLRILAIIGIVAYHFWPHRVSGGFIGVDVFLVLSGFLITRSLMPRLQGASLATYGQFLWSRVWRIGVPLLTMLIMSIGWMNLFAPSFLYNIRSTVLSSVLFVNNWWQILQGGSYFADFVHPSAFTHLWYIAVQMQLYALWPLLLFAVAQLLRGDRLRMAIALGMVALASALLMVVLFSPGSDPSRIYYGTDTRAFGFMLGGILGMLWRPEAARELLGKWSGYWADFWVVFTVFVLLVYATHMRDNGLFTYRGGLLMTAITACVLIAALTVPECHVARLLSHRVIRFIGKATFSAYLWYYPVYAVGMSSTFLGRFVWLQLLILVVLALASTVFIEGWLMRQLKDLGAMPRKARRHLVTDGIALARKNRAFLVFVLIAALWLVSAVVGMVRAPGGENLSVSEMQAQIAENQRLIAEAETAQRYASKADVPPIAGMRRSVQLFVYDQPVTFIGDSILLAAAKPLTEAFPGAAIDGEIGRQLNQSIPVVEQLAAANKMHDTVVVVLGSNGPFTPEQLDDFIAALGERRIYLVNTFEPRNWQPQVNEALTKAGERYEHVTLLDWKSIIDGHPEWLYEDMTHTNPDGAQAFTNFLAEALYHDAVSEEQQALDRAQDEKEKAAQQTASETVG